MLPLKGYLANRMASLLQEGDFVIEKYEARRIKQEIGRILWEQWDPIGVNSDEKARGEYDAYVNPVYVWLTDGSSDSQIAFRLLSIATERMGLSGRSVDDMASTVKALRRIPVNSA